MEEMYIVHLQILGEGGVGQNRRPRFWAIKQLHVLKRESF